MLLYTLEEINLVDLSKLNLVLGDEIGEWDTDELAVLHTAAQSTTWQEFEQLMTVIEEHIFPSELPATYLQKKPANI